MQYLISMENVQGLEGFYENNDNEARIEDSPTTRGALVGKLGGVHKEGAIVVSPKYWLHVEQMDSIGCKPRVIKLEYCTCPGWLQGCHARQHAEPPKTCRCACALLPCISLTNKFERDNLVHVIYV